MEAEAVLWGWGRNEERERLFLLEGGRQFDIKCSKQADLLLASFVVGRCIARRFGLDGWHGVQVFYLIISYTEIEAVFMTGLLSL